MNGILLIAKDEVILRSFATMLSPMYAVTSVISEQEGIEALKRGGSGIAAVLIGL